MKYRRVCSSSASCSSIGVNAGQRRNAFSSLTVPQRKPRSQSSRMPPPQGWNMLPSSACVIPAARQRAFRASRVIGPCASASMIRSEKYACRFGVSAQFGRWFQNDGTVQSRLRYRQPVCRNNGRSASAKMCIVPRSVQPFTRPSAACALSYAAQRSRMACSALERNCA